MHVAKPDQPVAVVMMRNAMNARMQQRVDRAQSERARSDLRQRNGARQQLFVSQRRGEHRRVRDGHMDVEVVRDVELVSARERPLPYAKVVGGSGAQLAIATTALGVRSVASTTQAVVYRTSFAEVTAPTDFVRSTTFRWSPTASRSSSRTSSSP